MSVVLICYIHMPCLAAGMKSVPPDTYDQLCAVPWGSPSQLGASFPRFLPHVLTIEAVLAEDLTLAHPFIYLINLKH